MKSKRVVLTIFLLSIMIILKLLVHVKDLTSNDFTASEAIDKEYEDTNIRNIEEINPNIESVFFVETQNTTEHKLSARQACSIESAGM